MTSQPQDMNAVSRGYGLAVTDMPDTHRRKEALEDSAAMPSGPT
jgi:hypothetical protein